MSEMTKIYRSDELNSFENVLINLEVSPWHALYRMAIGFGALPLISRLFGKQCSSLTVIASLLTALLMLRIVPAGIRKLFPFSNTLQAVWAERRRLAKIYDSYQWRKLLWIGIGAGLYTACPGQFRTARVVVSLICVLSGTLGLIRWRELRPNDRTAQAALGSRRANLA
jgi:hypothetical protein